MGFWARLWGIEDNKVTFREVTCRELFDAAADYTARLLAFQTCVNIVANAVGLCEFRIYWDGKEVHDGNYWLWNFEPGINENASAFRHKLINQLYWKNEALIIPTRVSEGLERFAVADDWEVSEQVTRENEYRSVRVGDLTFRKTFKEHEVIRLKLNNQAMEPIIRKLGESWNQMANAARKNYLWDHGQHWKVHVDQLRAGDDSFDAKFAQMLEDQVKPFLESDAAVLPEFDGYDYQRINGTTSASGQVADLRALVEDIFNWTAMGVGIPAVLVNGKVESTKDANSRFLTYIIDPIVTQIQQEGTRKVFGFEKWSSGTFMVVDSSTILHYDLFGEAANLEKLVGSGVYSINDLRRETGQATINEPWADDHYMTLNIKPVKEAATALGE